MKRMSTNELPKPEKSDSDIDAIVTVTSADGKRKSSHTQKVTLQSKDYFPSPVPGTGADGVELPDNPFVRDQYGDLWFGNFLIADSPAKTPRIDIHKSFWCFICNEVKPIEIGFIQSRHVGGCFCNRHLTEIRNQAAELVKFFES